jgi:radical SAM protein with 4Fe4S-binding SPASM domain
MPNSIIVSAPARLTGDIDADALIIRSSSCEELVTAQSRYQDKVKAAELELRASDVSLLSSLPVGFPLVLRLNPPQASVLYTSAWLCDRFPIAVTMAIDAGLLSAVKIVTSAQAHLAVDLDEVRDPGELMAVLHYYLHEPHLSVPVEFFHTLFSACVEGERLSLADMYSEEPDRFLHVDDSGRVTASARFAAAGKYFGELAEGLVVSQESPLLQEIRNRKKNLFLSRSACASCEVFDLCGGYLRFVTTEFDCSPFVEIMQEIKARAREMAEDIRRARETGA